MKSVLSLQRVNQLREEIEELKFTNDMFKYKKGPVADTDRVRRQGRLLEIQDELKAMTKHGAVMGRAGSAGHDASLRTQQDKSARFRKAAI